MDQNRFLQHVPSSYSFHIEAMQIDEPEETLKFLPKSQKILSGIFLASQMIQITITYLTIQQFKLGGHSEIAATFVITTLRAVFVVLLFIAFLKTFEPQYIILDQSHKKLILLIAGFSILGTLGQYYGFSILPFSQAVTIGQLVPLILGVIVYKFLKPTDKRIIYFAVAAILLSFTFEAKPQQLAFILISPVGWSAISFIEQIQTKPINKFTMILYSNLVTIPALLLICAFTGNLLYLSHSLMIIGAFFISLFQIISLIVMKQLLQQEQITGKDYWSLQAMTIGLALLIQIVVFRQELVVLPFLSQVIIVVLSIISL